MDTKCNRDVILKISLLKFDWKSVGNRLLGDQDVIDINCEEHEEQNKREKMLLKWLQQKGGGATYKRLVDVLEVLKYKETAEAVTRLVMDDGGGGIQPSPSQHPSTSPSSSPQRPRETQRTPPHHPERGQPFIADEQAVGCPVIVRPGPTGSVIEGFSGFRGNVAIIVDRGACQAQPPGGFNWSVCWGDGAESTYRQTTLGPFQAAHQYPMRPNRYDVTVKCCSNSCCDVITGTIATFP